MKKHLNTKAQYSKSMMCAPSPDTAEVAACEKLKKELDKCRLLCANCHRMVHHEYESNWGSDWVDDGV